MLLQWVVLPDDSMANEFLYLSLGDKGVVDVQSTVFPLDRAVDIQGIA